eukprot:7979319-Alexandrium_andersonii.AAC.1
MVLFKGPLSASALRLADSTHLEKTLHENALRLKGVADSGDPAKSGGKGRRRLGNIMTPKVSKGTALPEDVCVIGKKFLAT